MSLTAEQLAMRKTGIAASELASVCGLSPWGSAIEVWERKVGVRDDDLSLNANIIRGTLFEAPVIAWYTLLSSRKVVPQTTLRHPKHPIMLATPDGVAFKDGDEPRCLEIKCPGPFTLRHWGAEGSDEIPEYYVPQVQAQMAVTGLQTTDVVMFSGIEPKIYHVDYDDEFFQATREIAEKFFTDYVLTGTPPPPDTTAAYGDFLARHAPMRDAQSTVDLSGSDEAVRWMQQLKEAQKASKYAAACEEEAKNNLKALMGENASARVPGGRITWRNTKQVRRIQWPELAKSLSIPSDVIEKHVKMGDAPRPFKVMWDKEEHV
ncbi:MAG: YqaJ viral recombinase family protein [Janthinobacterium lividum]